METCLLLVDLQNDYFPGGKMELAGIMEAAANAQSVLNMARQASLPVIHIQHISARPGSAFFLPGSEGADINQLLAPQADETVIVKHFPNSFRNTSLLDMLQQKGIKELIICGAMSHMCIDATARAAFDLGFSCTVVHDACATRDLNFGERIVKAADVHASFMAALSAVYARVVPTEAIAGSLIQ